MAEVIVRVDVLEYGRVVDRTLHHVGSPAEDRPSAGISRKPLDQVLESVRQHDRIAALPDHRCGPDASENGTGPPPSHSPAQVLVALPNRNLRIVEKTPGT